MIRKFGHVDAPPELVQSIFVDVEAWPEWQPGLHTTDVLDRTETTVAVDVKGRFMGHRMHGVLDCRIEPEGFYQNQRTGWLKRWTTHWHFTTPPDGRGTTVICELDIDTGFIGALVPSSFVRRFVDRMVEATLVNLDAHAAGLQATAGPATPQNGDTETLLEVFETPAGYEVLVGGRRFKLDSKD